MNTKVVGVDLAKNVFQVCAVSVDGIVLWNRKVPRQKLLLTISQFPEGTLVAMEACSTSNYWGRLFASHGYKVLLLPAQRVKPYASRQKNDANDALAICEAALRPGIHPVSVKSIEQQDIKSLRGVRGRLVRQRTALANQIRALAGEYGVVFPVGIASLRRAVPEALEDENNGLTCVARRLLSRLVQELRSLDETVDEINRDIAALCTQLSAYHDLMTVPGIGPVVSSALISEVGDAKQFANGRQMAAWLGLVPRQHSSGGKAVLSSITKHGNNELRVLVIHGARAVVRFVARRNDPLGRWVKDVISRRGKNKAIVALANKLTRIVWSILANGGRFDANRAFSA